MIPKIIFLIRIIVLYSSKYDNIYTSNELYPKPRQELFSLDSINYIDKIGLKIRQDDFKMYALSKLMLKKHSSFSRYILLLAGDIEINPGPARQPCSICSKLTNTRSLFCSNCNLATHKKCVQIQFSDSSKFLCQRCSLPDLNIDPSIFPFSGVNGLDELNNPTNITTEHENSLNSNLENIEENTESEIWQHFKKRGLHMIHININSLVNKIHELRFIAQKSNPTIIGITESKLDQTILDSEICIDGYSIFRSDRTRNGGGVVMYVNKNIGAKERVNFSKEIENVFVDILLPKTKPILVGILYNPFQTDFLHNLSTAISNTDNFDNQEVYLLGDFNINLWHKEKYIFHNSKTLSQQEIHQISRTNAYDIIKYQEFCSLHGLKQLISTPTRITENKSSLLDHILTNTNENVSHFGVMDVGLSDHQLIYATRKKTQKKNNVHREITIRSFKNYTIELYQRALKTLDFPNYENFTDMDAAYTDFIDKLVSVINKIAPIKTIRAKNHTEEWFDGEVSENILIRDKLFKKYKKSRLHVDKEIFNAARNKVQNLITKKKRMFFETKIKDNIGKPKELWKTINSLGLSTKTSGSKICLKNNGKSQF